MKEVFTQLESVSGELADYLVVTDLPSKFRSYDVDKVYVRGLYWGESNALSKYVGLGKASYRQLASIYADAIKGINILDLEIVDFITLLTISSIYTVKDFGWIPNVRCIHTFLNPEYTKLIKDLEQLQFEGKDKELEEMLIANVSIEKELRCEGFIEEMIVLDDLDFTEPIVKKLPVPIKLGGKDINIGAFTLGDQITLDELKEDESIDQDNASYALLIKNELPFEEKYKLICYGQYADVMAIKAIDAELDISIANIPKKCPKCGKINNLKIGLYQIKAYP